MYIICTMYIKSSWFRDLFVIWRFIRVGIWYGQKTLAQVSSCIGVKWVQWHSSRILIYGTIFRTHVCPMKSFVISKYAKLGSKINVIQKLQCWWNKQELRDIKPRRDFYGGPQGQSTTQYWAGYTTIFRSRYTKIFRDTKQFFTVHNNLSWYKRVFSRYTTIFRDAKQFFTVHNNLWWNKTIFHGTQQSSVMQNNFSWNATIFRDITAFHDAKLNFTIQN